MTLVSGLKEGLHTIKVIKRSNGYYSYVTVSKIQLNAGAEIRTTQKYFERKILFLGDDFTTGYGSKVTNAMVSAGTVPTAYSSETEDSTIGYTSLAADYFGAENMTVALMGGSGRGIGINGNGKTDHIASSYFEYLDYRQWMGGNKVVYDHTQYDPDIIVINLGNYDEHYYSNNTNSDGGATLTDAEKTTFETNCKNFILRVRASYPTAKILYTYGINYNAFVPNVQNVITSLTNSGYRDIYFKQITKLATAEKGLSGKPTTEAHAARSTELIAAIKEVTGWAGKDELKNPVSSEVQLDTEYGSLEKTDITVMSYNVLAHDSAPTEIWEERQPKVIKMVNAYNPDIIGFQEAAGVYDTYGHDWPGYLQENLASEYTVIRLDKQTNGTSPLKIGNGLVIAYRTERFECLENGCKQYTTYTEGSSSYNKGTTYTVSDTSRWFQWAKLKDKNTGQVFYFYNTHLTVNGSTPAEDRVSQCRILAQHIIKTNSASTCPFFITGDFNTSFASGTGALEKLTQYSKMDDGNVIELFKDAASVADFVRLAKSTAEIDHIFIANRYVDVKEYHVAYENVEGRRTSDHALHIAYCNFKPHTTAGLTSGLDESGKVFTDSTSANTYTFNFTLGTSVAYSIFDESGNVVSGNTVSLSKRTNRFGLYFKDGKGNYICTIEAIITNTSVAAPTITATGSVVNKYFANGAYHILANGDTLELTSSNGYFYENPHASRGETATLALTAIKAGRTVYYLKTTAGDKYPVYIYKQTAVANTNNSVLYVEDDTEEATGTVAFYDGKDVIFADAGTKIFGTVAAVAAKANTIDGATIYFAPGNYKSNDVLFTSNVTLLGNNYDVSAVEIKTPNWSKAGRKPETVIDGGFVFRKEGNISVTVKGFTIEGVSTNGPIFVDDITSSIATRAIHLQTLDIQNNVIMGGGNGTNNTTPAAVQAYSGAKVAGLIKNNYFRSTISQPANGDAGYTRGIWVRNLNGLTVDNNYFIGYEKVCQFRAGASDDVAGNADYAVIGNRFEHCGTSENYLRGITSEAYANVVYQHNDFIRCGGHRTDYYTLVFYFNEGSLANDCSKISISIIGNRFVDSYHSIWFRRKSGGGSGDLSQMTLRFNRNSIINPTEGVWPTYFRSIYFDFLAADQVNSVEPTADKWNFADNVFESVVFTEELSRYFATHEKYNSEITQLNFIRNAVKNKNSTTIPSVILEAAHFTTQVTESHSSISGAFGKADGVNESNDTYTYDFDEDASGMTLDRGTSGIKDAMVFGVNSAKDDSITVTTEKTLEFKGRTSLYTANRWDSTGQVSFDIKTTSTVLGSNRSAFHFKFGHWLSVANRELTNSDFYRGQDIEGCFITFATTDTGGPSVKLYISHKTANGKASETYTFNNIVESFTEFNTFRLVEAELGMIDLYMNGNRFARLECYDNVATYSMRAVATTADSYYDNIDVYAVQNGNLVKQGNTITDSLVTKDTAIAFATSNGKVNDSTQPTYGETMEIDNLLITSNTDIVTDEPTDDPVINTPGTITITDAKPGVDYNAYKMADVTYASGAYSYKVAAGWEEFFAGNGEYAVVLEVFSVNGGYITRKNVSAEPDAETMAKIARLAVKYAQQKSITPAGTAKADENGNAVINVSTAGYYVVDSALGTLCSVGTFNGEDGNVNIQEKNDVPTLEKFVKEGSSWKKANDAAIGKPVEFKILITVAQGATGYSVENGATGYSLHDELAAGFKLVNITSVKEYASRSDYNSGTEKKTYVKDTDYTYSATQTEGKNSYEIAFADDTIKDAAVLGVIEVVYRATVDTDATIDATPNTNIAYMKYGEDVSLETVSVITNTYVWSFGINKYYNKDSVETALPGAQFALYNTNPVGNNSATPLHFVSLGNGSYRLATSAEISDNTVTTTPVLESPQTGDYRIQGLDGGTYYLVETAAPAGFNKLGAPIQVTIASNEVPNNETQLTKIVTQGSSNVLANGSDVIKVLNQSGLVLPSTGGYTQIFIIVGCMMVMSMGTLLVVRKRMTKVVYIRNDFYDDEEYED